MAGVCIDRWAVSASDTLDVIGINV
jgi:hypothetical protein